MSAISVSTGPAARGADGIRGSLVGPARRLGARKSIHGGALVDGSVPRSALDPYALQLRNRYAAKSLGGSSSTAGAFASFIWDPGQDVTVSFVYASAVTPASALTIFGRSAANAFNIRVATDGAITFRENTNNLVTTAAASIKFDGYTHTLSLRVTGTTVVITHDGVVIGSGTFASLTWGSWTYFIGADSSSAPRWPGAIWNLEGTDHGTAANGFTFLMDEPPTSTTFVNTLSGTSVGNAAKGTGAAFPWVTSVASTDGRGMPFQGVGPLVYGATTGGGVEVFTGASAIFAPDQAEADPTGSYNSTTGVWTAPCAGTATVLMAGTMRPTTLGAVAAPEQIRVRKNSVVLGFAGIVCPRVNSDYYPISASSGPVTVAAADTLDVYVSANAANTEEVLGAVTIIFYPTPTIG